jgi:hypothetical protein
MDEKDIVALKLEAGLHEDPFAVATRQPGVTEVRIGRTDARENGKQPAPSIVKRAQWPFHEKKPSVAPTKPVRRGVPW